jgi:23S rRNA (cytosine1962-C5)-methyltransferase
MVSEIHLLSSPNWKDYELLDSGDGLKLERFGLYTFVRPEVQALWTRTLPASSWDSAHAIFQPSGEESGGHWTFLKKVPEQWEMKYTLHLGASTQSSPRPIERGELRFSVMTTPGRHLGVFPECAAHWDWMVGLICDHYAAHQEFGEKQKNFSPHLYPSAGVANTKVKESPLNVLNLFGYTGLASLACAFSGSKVTHVDASKKSVSWARTNQAFSGLAKKPIRWIVDDALKFVEREARRGVKYDAILLDPPKFGRGPKGEVWEIYQSLPKLLQACREVLNDHPLFVVLTVYAVKLPAIHAYSALAEMMKNCGGNLECGELVTEEKSAGRLLSQAVYARWNS